MGSELNKSHRLSLYPNISRNKGNFVVTAPYLRSLSSICLDEVQTVQ